MKTPHKINIKFIGVIQIAVKFEKRAHPWTRTNSHPDCVKFLFLWINEFERKA